MPARIVSEPFVLPDAALHLMLLESVECAGGEIPLWLKEALDAAPLSTGTLRDFVASAVRCCHAIPLERSRALSCRGLSDELLGGVYSHIEESSRDRVRFSPDELDAEQGRDPYALSDWMAPYEVRSLEGIDALINLESLEWSSAKGSPVDLTPLANHPALTTLGLSGTCRNVRVLATCPKLRRVFWQGAHVDDPSIADALTGRVQFL
jgi:hypothetical protein